MLWLYRFICGYVLIAIKGDYCERLINKLVKNRISVWHIKKKKGAIHACVFARDFKRLPQFKGRTAVKIHIISKTGMPFIIKKYKHRPGIAVGIIAFFVIIHLLSGYIWNIKVEGNDRINEQSILDSCRSIGIAEGVSAKSINPQNARVELLLKQQGLSWASVNIEGSCATVNVREFENPEKKDEKPCNLKSAVSGVVVSTKVTKGDVCVKPGDTVIEGQLLVSGAVTHADGSTEFVKSEGEVIIETTRTFVQTIDYEQTEIIKNGNVKTRCVLNMFGLQIPLYLGEIKGDYEKEISVNKISVNTNYAPIYIIKARFFQTEETRYKIDKDKAVQKAQKNIEKEILGISGFTAVSYKDDITDTDTGITLKRDYICRENAIKEDVLLIDTFN